MNSFYLQICLQYGYANLLIRCMPTVSYENSANRIYMAFIFKNIIDNCWSTKFKHSKQQLS